MKAHAHVSTFAVAYGLLVWGNAAPANAAQNSDEQAYKVVAELHSAVTDWVAATNARDLNAQIAFYPDRVPAFYRWRNASRAAVFAEKRRVFERAELIDIKIEPPQILIGEDGASARMYFRKQYAIVGERIEREGEVLQELRWVRTAGGWKIVSERDLRVLN